MHKTNAPVAIYFEHPDWFRPLFAELDRRSVPYLRLDARCHSYDLSNDADQFDLFFNRMSASAYLRGHGQSIFFTRDYLAHLERNGTRVVNGARRPSRTKFPKLRNCHCCAHSAFPARVRA